MYRHNSLGGETIITRQRIAQSKLDLPVPDCEVEMCIVCCFSFYI